jgi:hypothetical protein
MHSVSCLIPASNALSETWVGKRKREEEEQQHLRQCSLTHFVNSKFSSQKANEEEQKEEKYLKTRKYELIFYHAHLTKNILGAQHIYLLTLDFSVSFSPFVC